MENTQVVPEWKAAADEIWAMMRETDRRMDKRMEETDRRMRETDRRMDKRMEETDRQMKETDRRIEKSGLYPVG